MSDRIRFDVQWQSYKGSRDYEQLENALKRDCHTFYKVGAEQKASELKVYMKTLQTNLFNEKLDDAAFRKLTGDVLAEMFKHV